MRQRWVYIDGEAIEVTEDNSPDPQSAMVMGDIKPYQSMVTGEWITSRSHHRDHLKAHKVIEVGNETKYLQPKRKEIPAGLKQTIREIAAEKLRYK